VLEPPTVLGWRLAIEGVRVTQGLIKVRQTIINRYILVFSSHPMSTLAVFREMTGVTNTEGLEISLDCAKRIAAKISAEIPPQGPSPTPIAQYQVQSLVIESRIKPDVGTMYIAPSLPPFASHWAVVVGDIDSRDGGRLCHLVLAEFEGNMGVRWEDRCVYGQDTFIQRGQLTRLGYTKYHEYQLVTIGRRMIDEFGDYHTVFWNCQMFAKCFLRVITDDEAVWDKWTSADVASLFLCAFIIPAPLATTTRIKQGTNENRVVKAGQAAAAESVPSAAGDSPTDAPLKILSERVIKEMFEAGIDEARANKIDRLKDSPSKEGLIKRIWKMFTSSSE